MEPIHVTRLDPYRLKIERRPPMRTWGLVFASPAIERSLAEDQAIQQVANVACLPGIVGPSMAMPDIHWGYGFPIGGVAAFETNGGIVSPGGVGYDINCGIRCVRTALTLPELMPQRDILLAGLYNAVPAGVGSTNKALKIGAQALNQVLVHGAAWVAKQGYIPTEDLEAQEDYGRIALADPEAVSKRAVERGMPELGTLGSGNHFLELDVVEEILDAEIAQGFGLFENQIVIQVHTGSRGLGHQVCDDYVHSMIATAGRQGIVLPDRQLACAYLESAEAKAYLAAMAAAANFAFANRSLITFFIRQTFERIFGKSSERLGMDLLYDCCHNIAKIERVSWEGRQIEVCVHRKGATRALLPGDPRLPERYRATGQPVLVPGDMGRASYILAGGTGAHETFLSACHGAGRLLSRSMAKRRAKGRSILDELKRRDIHAMAASRAMLAEEMPEAYKDVSAVVDTMTGAGVTRTVARLRPVAMIKG
ncbi:MAG TPA: RtcB family protein [Deltaproteobacteria bacterium]|nr:RtcB family protein [Deltaproteobacteria bacterium]